MEAHLPGLIGGTDQPRQRLFHVRLNRRELLLPGQRVLVDEREGHVEPRLAVAGIPVRLVRRHPQIEAGVLGVHLGPRLVGTLPIVVRKALRRRLQIRRERLLPAARESLGRRHELGGRRLHGGRTRLAEGDGQELPVIGLFHRHEGREQRLLIRPRFQLLAPGRGHGRAEGVHPRRRSRRAGQGGALRVLLGLGRQATRTPVAAKGALTRDVELLGLVRETRHPVLPRIQRVDLPSHVEHAPHEALLGGRQGREIVLHQRGAALVELLQDQFPALGLRRSEVHRQRAVVRHQAFVGLSELRRELPSRRPMPFRRVEQERAHLARIHHAVPVRILVPEQREVLTNSAPVHLFARQAVIARSLRRSLCGGRSDRGGHGR